MSPCKYALYAVLTAGALIATPAVQASTLFVNCGGKTGLTTVNAALKLLRHADSGGSSTINVSGACSENITIQGVDRLTLNALPGASITDASGGTLDVIDIADSHDVAINNFTISGGAETLTCQDRSLCRLNGNTIQGGNADGVGVYFSQVDINGGVVQNNPVGLQVFNDSGAKVFGTTVRNNETGIIVRTQSFLNTDATVTGNSGTGMFVHTNAAVHCLGCTVTNNGDHGIIIRRNSTVRFNPTTVTGNIGGGILLTEESSAFFPNPGNVTANTGGLDVACGASANSAKLATININGGTTNCIEPIDP